MNNMMSYRDYIGSVEYSDADETFHGRLMFIRALVTYEGDDVKTLKKAFYEAVDDYLGWCKKSGKLPEKPFKGSFNVRLSPDLHRRAALYAEEHDSNLNRVVSEALQSYFARG